MNRSLNQLFFKEGTTKKKRAMDWFWDALFKPKKPECKVRATGGETPQGRRGEGIP